MRFDIEYYIEGNIKVTETFNSPFIIKCNNTSNLKGKKIKLKYHDEDSFIFIDLSNDKEQTKNLNEKFFFEGQQISVEYNIDFNSGNSDIPNTIVKFQSLNELTNNIRKKLILIKLVKNQQF